DDWLERAAWRVIGRRSRRAADASDAAADTPDVLKVAPVITDSSVAAPVISDVEPAPDLPDATAPA
ncbi:MAG: hypothetical protein ACJ780_15980, partial [Solirubrobacteraceae bacterium]